MLINNSNDLINVECYDVKTYKLRMELCIDECNGWEWQVPDDASFAHVGMLI